MPIMIEIREVITKKDLKKFIQFPKKLYKDCPYYVPPLDQGEWETLTRHPALDFCDIKLWLAHKDGEIVGRIAGIINKKCNEIKGQKRIRFGWFDTIDDAAVAKALFQKVEEWGRSRQLTEICGPSRYSNMDKQSMLIEGFDRTPPITSDYNFPYYPALVEQLGFEKEVDYIQYDIEFHEVPESIIRISQIVNQRCKVHIRPFKNKKELKAIGRDFFYVLNESYQHIFNFIPLTDKEIDWLIDNDFSVAVKDLIVMLADENNKIVGISFCLPSLSEGFKKAKGKLFPFGWYHILHALKDRKVVDMFLTGVLPQYANSGIHAIYHKELQERFCKMGFSHALSSQQLENNPASRIWKKYDNAEIVFRRRCYKKDL